jgi:Na+-driven multidrug efflux pump
MQSTAAFIVICSQYIIALPASYIFAITLEQGIKGIWQALILGNITQLLLYYIVLAYRVKWDEKALEISEKMRGHKKHQEKHT